MAQMASGKPRSVSGEFTSNGSTIHNIVHNLGTRKIFMVAQRVNENHENIDQTTSRYRSILLMAATKEALQFDAQQTYSYNGGNQVGVIDTGTNNTYPSGLYGYFPTADGTALTFNAFVRPDRGISVVSDNEIRVETLYGLETGRWIYSIYALD